MLPTPQPPSSIKKSPLSAATSCIRRLWEYCIEEVDDPMAERRADALLVASSVIAAMNYQAVLSPPGGSFQATEYRITRVDKPEQEQTGHTNIKYEAGQAIVAYINPVEYRCFTTANTISFAFSMTTMFLLLSGISLKRRIFSFLLTLSMFATITATAYSYKCGMEATTPDHDEKLKGWKFVKHLVNGALISWYVIAGVAFAAFVGKLLEPPLTSAYRRATQKT